MLSYSSMSGEVAAKLDRDAMIHAIDRNGQAIDLALGRSSNASCANGSQNKFTCSEVAPAARPIKIVTGISWLWSRIRVRHRTILSCHGACEEIRACVLTSSCTPRASSTLSVPCPTR